VKYLDVVGAVIVHDDHVLCAQRGGVGPLAGLWEFPGGKIEPGESPAAALMREIGEELGCEISVGSEIVTTTHAYDFAVIRLTTFYCTLVDGVPTAGEHAALEWRASADLMTLEWAPADIPAVQRVQADLAG
jgi:8-oxo-dGTP diphosphatase